MIAVPFDQIYFGGVRPEIASNNSPPPVKFTVTVELNGQENTDRKMMTVFSPLSLEVFEQRVFSGARITAQIPDRKKHLPMSILIYGLGGDAVEHVGGDKALVRIDGATYSVDIGGAGGGQLGTVVARVSGSVEIADQPKSRQVVAVSYSGDPRQVVGQAASDAAGNFTLRVSTTDEIILLALDDFGELFADGLALLIGDRVRPTVANGWVYECITDGAISGAEPEWPTDGSIFTIGTAQVKGHLYFQPEAHAPIKPEPL